MSWTLQSHEGHVENVADAANLRRRLCELQEEAKVDPFFVVLNAPDGSTFAVGLGRALSALSYTAPGGWPAQHIVNSDAGDDLLTFKFLGHFSEMPSRYAVPLQDALDAAVDFFTSGTLTDRLTWEND